jgi:hypothetical protein
MRIAPIRQLRRHRLLSRALTGSSVGSYDAVIVGAGIIGASVALELSKKGYRTLNIDQEAGSGQGSTAWSSGVIRTFYTATESCKFSWEGYQTFANWKDHVGVHDELGLAPVREVGAVLLKTPAQADFLSKVCASSDVLAIPYKELSNEQIMEKYGWDLRCYAPPKRIDDDTFGEPNSSSCEGGILFPKTAYVSDPMLAAHNIQRAAEFHGATFLFKHKVRAVKQKHGRVSGVRVVSNDGGGSFEIPSGVVVNVGGPHSCRITDMAFGMKGDAKESAVANDMRVHTRPLKQEVACSYGLPVVLIQEVACSYGLPVVLIQEVACSYGLPVVLIQEVACSYGLPVVLTRFFSLTVGDGVCSIVEVLWHGLIWCSIALYMNMPVVDNGMFCPAVVQYISIPTDLFINPLYGLNPLYSMYSYIHMFIYLRQTLLRQCWPLHFCAGVLRGRAADARHRYYHPNIGRFRSWGVLAPRAGVTVASGRGGAGMRHTAL